MFLALLTIPFATLICLGLFGRNLGARGTMALSVLSACICTGISFVIFYEVALCACPCQIHCADFVTCELFDAAWGFLFDTLTAVMCVVVTLISALVIFYSCSYMISDPHCIRFLSFLKLFMLAMLILVTANNYIQLFVGWEGVGLASFLLISFWFNRLQATKAAIQAMLVNRVGDLFLALGIATLYFCYKTTDYNALFCTNVCSLPLDGGLGSQTEPCMMGQGWCCLDLACVLLLLGAAGKSGQLGLHIWLPNAMNAPTPVSALLHAATMVTAGVFLLARSSALFEYAHNAAALVVILGALTAVAAGTMNLVQHDFKGVIAYSTCSQLGYMVTTCGLSNYHLGMYHLFNHAFMKALLFLTSGVIIHSLCNEQDIRKFGSLQQTLVFSYCAFLIGTLALIGTPWLTGFYSKDLILELACARYALVAYLGYLLTAFSVFTTSFYSFRLLFMVFCGAKQTQHQTNLHKTNCLQMHDADWVMGLVLVLLACGSLYAGWCCQVMFRALGTDFWNNSIICRPEHSYLVEAEFLPFFPKLLTILTTLGGALCAYACTIQWTTSSAHIAYFKPVYEFCNQRWFFDKLVNQLLALPGYKLGFHFLRTFDKGLLELLPMFGQGLCQGMKQALFTVSAMQSGWIHHYATMMVISTLLALLLLTYQQQLCFDYDLTMVCLVCVCLSAWPNQNPHMTNMLKHLMMTMTNMLNHPMITRLNSSSIFQTAVSIFQTKTRWNNSHTIQTPCRTRTMSTLAANNRTIHMHTMVNYTIQTPWGTLAPCITLAFFTHIIPIHTMVTIIITQHYTVVVQTLVGLFVGLLYTLHTVYTLLGQLHSTVFQQLVTAWQRWLGYWSLCFSVLASSAADVEHSTHQQVNNKGKKKRAKNAKKAQPEPFEPSEPQLEEPVLDPSASDLDASEPALDPSEPVLDPSEPLLDPESQPKNNKNNKNKQRGKKKSKPVPEDGAAVEQSAPKKQKRGRKKVSEQPEAQCQPVLEPDTPGAVQSKRKKRGRKKVDQPAVSVSDLDTIDPEADVPEKAPAGDAKESQPKKRSRKKSVVNPAEKAAVVDQPKKRKPKQPKPDPQENTDVQSKSKKAETPDQQEQQTDSPGKPKGKASKKASSAKKNTGKP